MTPSTTIGRGRLLAVLAWWTVRLVPHPLDAGRITDSFLDHLRLPLLGGSTGAEVTGHDWEAILEPPAHIAGSVVMVGALAAGGWCLRRQDLPEQAEA